MNSLIFNKSKTQSKTNINWIEKRSIILGNGWIIFSNRKLEIKNQYFTTNIFWIIINNYSSGFALSVLKLKLFEIIGFRFFISVIIKKKRQTFSIQLILIFIEIEISFLFFYSPYYFNHFNYFVIQKLIEIAIFSN